MMSLATEQQRTSTRPDGQTVETHLPNLINCFFRNP